MCFGGIIVLILVFVLYFIVAVIQGFSDFSPPVPGLNQPSIPQLVQP